MDWKLELIILPVADVDKTKAFYIDQLGFALDVDHRAGENFRVVQMTPPGSTCSISIGTGITQATPGSVQGLHLVVSDIEAAHAELSGREVEPGGLFHFGPAGQVNGPHPDRTDYNTFFTFADPDGNGWLVQEVGWGKTTA